MFRSTPGSDPFCMRAWCVQLMAALAMQFLVSSCATVPNADAAIDGAQAADGPRVVGAKGPLSTQQSKALFERLKLNPENSDVLKRHLVVEEEIAETPLVAGNTTRLLRDG